jgi:hypothetical protein
VVDDFTKRSQFGAEVEYTEASWPFFELKSVDATERTPHYELPRLLKARIAP